MSQRRPHRLIAAAAVCVIAACAIAAAAISGFIPDAASRKAPCTDCGALTALPGGVTGAVIASQFGHGDGRPAIQEEKERLACSAC